MLYLIGLGLGDAKDVTVRGLEVIRSCARVYLEAYTSILTVGKEHLEEYYGRELILADRETVEQDADEILRDAAVSDIAFLVVGDPFGATTHSDLVLRAAKAGIQYRVIHNASILSAVGCCGLQVYTVGGCWLHSSREPQHGDPLFARPESCFSCDLCNLEVCGSISRDCWRRCDLESHSHEWYPLEDIVYDFSYVLQSQVAEPTPPRSCIRSREGRDTGGVDRQISRMIQLRYLHQAYGVKLYNFGETVSIVFWTDTWKPESFYDKIRRNRLSGMHTMCLLDIKVKEQSIENLMKGKKVFEPPRYMTVNQAVEQLLQIVQNRREQGEELALSENTICAGLARVGASDQRIATGTLQQLSTVDFGAPLHSLVISGCMHPLELDMLRLYAVDPSFFDQINVEDSSTYRSS